MSRRWQLQDAKAHFSRLIKQAAEEGPQTVTLHGVDAAVVLSMEEYRRLSANKPSFAQFLLAAPRLTDEEVDLINQRSQDTGRDLDL